MRVVMLLFPRLTQLDLTGPLQVLANFRELDIDLVWQTLDPVSDATGLRLSPTATFATCPQADILFVPGGPGQCELMEDAETLGFLRRQGEAATWITSVCTGSLVLAAAGLLTGYAATCHWLSAPQLAHFGATPTPRRVVIDRNRITGAGVTSGIDFALSLAAELFGERRARLVQLALEYDPAPPFSGGSPASAPADMIDELVAATAAFQTRRDAAARRAAARLSANA